MTRSEVAAWGEAEAARYLRRIGWEILATNWHCRYGEIDLIARDGPTLVFVEVKTRRSRSFGRPEEAITPGKLRRLARAIWTYVEQQGAPETEWRMDVIAIEGRPGGSPLRLDHYPDALPGDEDWTT